VPGREFEGAARRLGTIAQPGISDSLESPLSVLEIGMRLGKVPLVFHFHGPWAGESGVEGASALRIAIKKTLERIVYSRAISNVLTGAQRVADEAQCIARFTWRNIAHAVADVYREVVEEAP